MKLFFLDIQLKSFLATHRTTAASKPGVDAIEIASRLGFRSKVFYYWESENNIILKRHPYLPNRLLKIQLSLFSQFTKDSIILVQIPFRWQNLHGVLKQLKKRNKIIILAHDIDAIRGIMDGARDMETLRLADGIIAHTPQMIKYLNERGVHCPCISLQFFDYLVKCDINHSPISRNGLNILYAGNLGKSQFLNLLSDVHNVEQLQFNLYGKDYSGTGSKNIIYRGVFDNESINNVVGDWGLVWDGDSIEKCNNAWGVYLKYNAPYKFSLYLAMGIPVIVWRESAMAQYVDLYHLGICVDSLNDIYETIQRLTDSELSLIQEGVKKYSANVKSGLMLSTAIKQVLSILEQ